MIIAEVDVRKTLFLDVMGDEPRPELEPRLWRSAINTDPLFGRFFGFHYAPEMRSFLSVVNIARGSISSAAASTADKSSPIIRNIAALGWGWVYSNMVILNNLGVTIDGVSQIGSDRSHAPHGIEQVRMFMNLAEDPFVSGVAALASADVAIDHVFSIFGDRDQGKEIGGVSALETRRVPIPVSPMPARVISYPGRPLARSALKNAPSISRRPAARTAELEALVDETAEVSATGGSAPVVRNGPEISEESAVDFAHVPRDAGSKGPLESLSGVVKQMQNQIGAAAARIMESPRPQPTSAPAGTAAVDRPEPAAASSISDSADTSVLASAIKNEFTKLHTNVSSFLGPHRGEPAPGLILHFHGGGFVSQSSAGHSIYLKEWAADLPDAVILSVDYRLAPENPYPCALEDCLFAYQWALENATLIGTKAERVVLCGDSAGGNLAVAVALKAQAYGLRPADGICLAYPALYVNVAWSPSRLLSFFDPLLPLSILDLCLRAYVPEGERSHDNPFISPLIASPDALRALPPVALITGSLDPLLDDAVQFAHNLRQCGRDGDTLHVVESLPHGFLNLVQVSRQARDASCLLSSRMAGMLGIKQRAGRGLATTDSDAGPAEGAAVAGGSSAEDTVAATLPAAALFDT
jgi:acetyl esterase/lipase